VHSSSNNFATCIHDAFQDFETYWNGKFNAASGDQNIILDTHQYQIFSPEQVAMSPSAHVSAACALGPKLAGTDKWTIVGEWTGAQTDCAKWLNGLGKGARYDGTFPGSSNVGSCNGKYTGTVSALSDTDKNNLASFIDAQLDAYEQRTGWIFWTWVTESAPEWHMKDLLAAGIFPQPLTSRKYPNQC
jgi:glucan 1,3-beta-glucosidase